jgi:WD40 repeat protein
VAFGVDGTTLTTGSYHGARLWEIPSGRERLRAAGANEVVVFSPDGARVASGGGDGDVSVWNLGRGDQLAQMAHSGAVRTMSFSPDGSKLATADDKGRVRLWSSAGELKAELKQPAFGTTRLVFSHDGRFLAAGARNPYLFIMNVEQDLAATSLATFRDAGDYVLSPRYVAAEGRDHRHVRIWETSGGRELTQIEALDLSAIKFDSTGTFLAIRQMDARGRSGTIRIWDLAHARERGRLAIKDRGEFALAPRGQFLTLAASEPGEKKFSVNHYADVWDVSTVRRVSRIPQDDTVAFIAFDPSGKRLLTIAGNFRNQQREVRVWELPTGKLKARLTHEEEIDAIRFSSEPDTLATLSAGRVYVWNLATSELLSQVTEASHIRDLRFSPDGRHLLTGSADGTAALWLWKTEDLRTEACKRLARNLSAAEWQHYLGGTKYQTSCPNLIVNERR